MKIIADSGSTKTDWVLLAPDRQVRKRVKTEGINPFHQSEADIRGILAAMPDLCPEDAGEALRSIHFYGSGLRPEFRPMLSHLLAERFNIEESRIEAEGDLLGAARALCGGHEGIACILGTGANSCLYDGTQIVQNTPPLGYILGDEGSGAFIGRNFLNAIYKGSLPKSLREAFEQEQNMTMADVIRRVYREPMANRWMASLSTFIHQQLPYYPALQELIVESFRQFLRRNIAPYQRPDLPISAVGSIAWYYREQLSQAAAIEGYRINQIEQTPIEGLLRYHSYF